MRRTILAAIAAIGAAAFGAGAAQAQIADPADENGAMYCVYNALTETADYELVAEAFLYDDLTDVEIKTAAELLDKATRDCATAHKLSESQTASASDIGIYGATADYLSDELMFEDVSDEAIDGIYDVMTDMSDDELDKLYGDDWRSDLAFSTKLKTALVAKGIPDDDFAVETSFQIIELAVMALDSVTLFVLGDEDEES